jgi:hypothetical protein
MGVADEVHKQSNVRLFFQLGGARPNSPLRFYGQQMQYAYLSGGSKSYGDIDPVYVHDPTTAGLRKLISRSRGAPDLPEATLMLLQKRGPLPRDLGASGCPFNVYLVVGNCGDLSDPLNGWTNGYVESYVQASPTDVDFGDRMDMESDDPLQDEYSLSLADIYRSGSITFGEQAATAIDREVVDLAYAPGISCGNCGPADDGTRRLYGVTKSSGGSSPGIFANVIYTQRDAFTGAYTVSEMDVTGLGAAVDPTFIEVMGQYLLVGVSSTNTLYYAVIDSITGMPGAFTAVTTGFVATKTINDIWVKSSNEAYICANGGYIYKLTDPTAGVTVLNAGNATTQNLNRIHGAGETIVAVGAAGAVVRSTNSGSAWAVTTAPSASALQAVWVIDPLYFWVGSAAGFRYYTTAGGTSWVGQQLPSATAITDIVFPTDEDGYTVYTTASASYVQATTFGGAVWADNSAANARIGQFPTTVAQMNRIAVPRATSDVNTNVVAIGGKATSGANSDGVLYIGTAAML